MDSEVNLIVALYENTYQKILGSDCALDLNSIAKICTNLKRFFEWSTENCRAGDIRVRKLTDRCNAIDRIRKVVQARRNN